MTDQINNSEHGDPEATAQDVPSFANILPFIRKPRPITQRSAISIADGGVDIPKDDDLSM